MEKLKEALWQAYVENEEIRNTLEIGSTEYKQFSDERERIVNEMIKLEQIKEDKETKELQIKSDNRNEKIRNGITIATFVTTTIFSVWSTIKAFRFDESGTFTSTLGRGNVTNLASKIFKR